MPAKKDETLISVWVNKEFAKRVDDEIDKENQKLKPTGKSINRKKFVIDALNFYMEGR